MGGGLLWSTYDICTFVIFVDKTKLEARCLFFFDIVNKKKKVTTSSDELGEACFAQFGK